MGPRSFALVAGVCALLIFAAINLAAPILLQAWRIDLSGRQSHSLAAASIAQARALREPVDVRLYVSHRLETRDGVWREAVARVRAILNQYRMHAGSRFRLAEHDPDMDPSAQRDAQRAGLQTIAIADNAAPAYFGLTIRNSVAEVAIVAAFEGAARTAPEAAIGRALGELDAAGKPNLAIITTLIGAGQARPTVFDALAALTHVSMLERDFTMIADDIDVLAILHPWALTPQQVYAVDQFLMRRGRAFIAVDPAFLAADLSVFASQDGPPAQSSLTPILGGLGLRLDDGVVLDLGAALPVEGPGPDGAMAQAPHPLYVRAPFARTALSDAATRGLTVGVNMAAAGRLAATRPGHAAPLLVSTMRTALLSSVQALQRPRAGAVMARAFNGGEAMLGVRVAGAPASVFGTDVQGGPRAHIAKAVRPVDVVVVADADFLLDRYYRAASGDSVADNGAFVAQAIQALAGEAMGSIAPDKPDWPAPMATPNALAWIAGVLAAALMMIVSVYGLVRAGLRRRDE